MFRSSIVLVLVVVLVPRARLARLPSTGNGLSRNRERDGKTGRRGSFLIVLVVVVVLALPARKTIDHDHDDENEHD
jgi:hypothetical protein